ncbi:MAG: 6-bladed beta-propeller [Prevotellaceae bacterium]|jgi:hypothetical protein|nr:6-bladed beta-propeller [Prevotellaceae bacterium]
MKYLYLFLAVFCLAGCNSGGNQQNAGDIEIYRLDRSNQQLSSALFDSVSFVTLKEDNEFFSRIDKLIIHGEYIYILDVWSVNSLLVFDNTGAFVRKIGNRGDGPGEYTRLYDFDVDFSFIYLYDYNKMRMLKYDLQGNFINETAVPFFMQGFKVLKNRKYLCAPANGSDKYQVVCTDSTFKIEASFLPFDNDNFADSKRTDNIFQQFGETISYNRYISDTVYLFSTEGKLINRVLFDFGDKTVPHSLRTSFENFFSGDDYLFYWDTPVKIHRFWMAFTEGKGFQKSTFLYDTDSGEHYFYEWKLKPGQLDFTDIYRPVFANSQYIVGYMDYQVYKSFKNKPVLDGSAVSILEEGGYVLCFYHLKH